MDYYIIFSGIIEQNFSTRLFNAITNAPKLNVDHINLFFSSLGGDVNEGFLLASVIQNSKVPITMHAYNNIDSIGNVIYLAAKERTAESYAKFYLHGALSPAMPFYEKGLIEQLSSVRAGNNRIAHFVSEHSNVPLPEVQGMMEKGTTLSAQEALGLNMVQNIVHKEVPQNVAREEIIFIN